MEQPHLLHLLAALITQILYQADENSTPDTAAEIAQECWNGLVLLLRELVLTQSALSLEGLGYFSKRGEEWSFIPSAAISESEALGLAPATGTQLLALRSISLLRHAEAVLHLLSEDVELKLTPEQRLLRAIFGETVERTTLSGELEAAVERLQKIRNNLLGHRTWHSEKEAAHPLYKEVAELPMRGEAYEELVKQLRENLRRTAAEAANERLRRDSPEDV